MLKKKNQSFAAFTLVELIIVIAIVGMIIGFSQTVNIKEINKGKNAELFTAKVARLFENTRNNALLGRSVGMETPNEWRIRFDLTNDGTFVTEYNDGTSWQVFDDQDYNFVVEDPQFIGSISCNTAGDVSGGEGIVVFKGPTLTLDGSCSVNDRTMSIGTNYGEYSGEVLINSVSGVIETE